MYNAVTREYLVNFKLDGKLIESRQVARPRRSRGGDDPGRRAAAFSRSRAAPARPPLLVRRCAPSWARAPCSASSPLTSTTDWAESRKFRPRRPAMSRRAMGFRDQLRRRRKDSRLILGGLVAAARRASPPCFVFLLRGRDLPASAGHQPRAALRALVHRRGPHPGHRSSCWLRNLLKLLVERRNRILGSKFKTKLVVTYVGLSLVPGLLLFFYASGAAPALDRALVRGARCGRCSSRATRWRRAMDRQIEESGTARARAGSPRELAASTSRDLAPARRASSGGWPRCGSRWALDLVAVYDGRRLRARRGRSRRPGSPTCPSRTRLPARGGGAAARRCAGRRSGRAAGARRGARSRRGECPAAVVVVGTLLDRELAARRARSSSRPTRTSASSRCRRGAQARPLADLPHGDAAHPARRLVDRPLPRAAGDGADPGARRRHAPDLGRRPRPPRRRGGRRRARRAGGVVQSHDRRAGAQPRLCSSASNRELRDANRAAGRGARR